MKKRLLFGWILATLINGHTFANPAPHNMYNLHLELGDPRAHFDANTSAWYTLSSLASYGLERLNDRADYQADWTRPGLFAAGLYLNAMLRYFSHEAAHEYAYRDHGIRVTNAIDLSNWKSSYIPGLYYPSWTQHSLDPAKLDDRALLESFVAGLNQDELNAAYLWRQTSHKGGFSVFEAQAFLLSSLRDIHYILQSGTDETPFSRGRHLHALQSSIFSERPDLYDDVNLYRLMLWNNGIDVTSREMLYRSLFASVMSWRTWESVAALFNFFRDQTWQSTTKIALSPSLSVSPPLITNYLGPESSFLNSSFSIATVDKIIDLQFGAELAYSGWRFRSWRMGFEMQNMLTIAGLVIDPAFALDFQAGTLSGGSAGAHLFYPIVHRAGIALQIQYAYNDLLINKIKTFSDGLRARLNVQVQLGHK